jgi:hypothetical protein
MHTNISRGVVSRMAIQAKHRATLEQFLEVHKTGLGIF